MVALSILWVLGMELASLHPSGTWNFEGSC